MDFKCVAIKQDGERCSHVRSNNDRCKMHHNILQRNGPHTTERNEELYKQKKEIDSLYQRFNPLIANEDDMTKRTEIMKDRDTELALMRGQHKRRIRVIERRQQEEIQRTGIDPDAAANARRQQEQLEREERDRQMMLNRINAARNGFIGEQAQILAGIVAARQANGANGDPNNNLRAFAKDNQNVHTSVAVKQTKDIVQKILQIPVPEEYQWNMKYCSKTPGEIIVDCKLTPKAAWQMQAKYSQDEDIYEMGKGIYGKVLDGVWQFVINSNDKADIISALRQELEDSIGMCAQGNLSRICNILAGFMEGIGSQESLAEILGRELPILMRIEDAKSRMKEAINLMSKNNVPREQWYTWVEPLFYDVEDQEELTKVFELIA